MARFTGEPWEFGDREGPFADQLLPVALGDAQASAGFRELHRVVRDVLAAMGAGHDARPFRRARRFKYSRIRCSLRSLGAVMFRSAL